MADYRAKWTKIWDTWSSEVQLWGTFHAWLGSLGTFCKIQMLRFLKDLCSNSFHPISATLYGKFGNQRGIQNITVLVICQVLKKLWHVEIFVNTGPYGVGNLETLLLLHFSVRPQANFMRTLATMVHWLPWWNTGYFLLAIHQVLTMLWDFEVVTWTSMGKS